MEYKGYWLTKFSCAGNNIEKVREGFECAIDLALEDEHFDKIGKALINDIFYLKTIKLLNANPMGEGPRFEIREIPEDETE